MSCNEQKLQKLQKLGKKKNEPISMPNKKITRYTSLKSNLKLLHPKLNLNSTKRRKLVKEEKEERRKRE